MQIKKLSSWGYGPLQGQINLNPGITVLFGQNEAGKSTLQQVIEDGLFGFDVKKADKHPHKHWDANDLRLSMEVETGEETLTVHRILGSDPNGWTEQNAIRQELKNQPLEDQVGRSLFRRLFRLSLKDLLQLEDVTWTELQSRIANQYGLDLIRQPHEVAGELRTEMHGLYRENRRGKYKVKAIEEEMSLVKKQISQVMQESEALASKKQDLDELQYRLKRLEDQLVNDLLELENLNKDLPILQLKEQQEGLVQQIKAGQAGIGIPDQLQRRKGTRDQLENRLVQVEEQLQALQGEKPRLNPLVKRLDHHEEEVLRALELGKEYVGIHQLIKQVDQQIKAKRNQVILLQGQLVEQPWDDDLVSVWQQIIPEDIQWHNKQASLHKHIHWILYGAAMASGVLAWFMKQAWLYGQGVVFAVLGYALSRQARRLQGKVPNLPLTFNPTTPEGQGVFLGKLYSMIEATGQLDQLLKDKTEKTQGLEALRLELAPLFSLLSISGDQTADQVEVLDKRYNEWKEKTSKSSQMTTQVTQLKDQQKELLEEHRANDASMQDLRAVLHGLHEDKDEAILMVQRAIMAKDQLQEVEAQLVGYPNLEWNLKQTLARVTSLQQATANMKEEKASLRVQQVKLEEQLRLGMSNSSLQQLQSKLAVLERDKEEAMDRWSYLRLMLQILEETDTVFHASHQPQLLQAASTYFKSLTGGRYTSIQLVEDNQGLHVINQQGRIIEKPDVLSRGTREQLYLSLRFAMMDVVDPSGTLPILLDEVFVNWDQGRRRQAIDLLSQVGYKRQVIVTTCHEWFASEVIDHGRVKVSLVNLEDREDEQATERTS